MAKSQFELPKGGFYLREDQPSPKGECPIYLRYYLKGKYSFRSTGFWVDPKTWDQRNQSVKKGVFGADQFNRKLISFKTSIDQMILESDGPITHELLRKLINNQDNVESDSTKSRGADIELVKYAMEYNENMYSSKKYGYTMYYNKKQNIQAFEWFVTHYDRTETVTLENVNLDVFLRYIRYRVDVRGNKSREGINKTLVPLYAAIEHASKQGLIDPLKAAPIISNYLGTKETEYNPETSRIEKIKYLRAKELKAMKSFRDKCKFERTKEILDIFLFCYFACGLRLSDILTLEWNNIDFKNKTLQKVQFKTKKTFDIPLPLSDDAIRILHGWEGKNSRFVFDLLPEDFNLEDQKKLFMERNSKDKTFNRSLQSIGDALNLSTKPTMHVARHSFAVYAINNGIDIYLLSKLMGHTSIQATEQTYAEFLKEKVEEQVKLIINNSL